jgi:hypothetical protein
MPAVLSLTSSAARDSGTPVVVRSPASLLGHLIEAVRAWQREASEDQVGRFIARNGGRLTDDLERQISRRFGGPV